MSTAFARWNQEAPLDLRTVIARLFARRWWIIASTLIVATICTVAALLLTPVYRATTVLVPADDTDAQSALGSALGQIGSLASLAGVTVRSGSPQMEALAVLRSRQFTERFIKDKQLMQQLFADKWDAVANEWAGAAPTPARAYKMFDRKIRSVAADKKTGLITVQIEWRDRIEAAAWANELVARLNLEMRSRAMAKAEGAVGYLEKELQSTSNVATREAIGRLIESQVKQRMLANVTREYAFRVVDPALPPDAADPVRPSKPVWILLGVFGGFGLGVLLVLFADWWRADGSEDERHVQ